MEQFVFPVAQERVTDLLCLEKSLLCQAAWLRTGFSWFFQYLRKFPETNLVSGRPITNKPLLLLPDC